MPTKQVTMLIYLNAFTTNCLHFYAAIFGYVLLRQKTILSYHINRAAEGWCGCQQGVCCLWWSGFCLRHARNSILSFWYLSYIFLATAISLITSWTSVQRGKVLNTNQSDYLSCRCSLFLVRFISSNVLHCLGNINL